MIALLYTISLVIIFVFLVVEVVNALARREIIRTPGFMALAFALIALALLLPRIGQS